MKFLFEFVSCCGSPRKEGERVQALAPPSEGGEEGRRWTRRRRKRRRGAAAEWKPSLCAISEDVMVVTVERVGEGGGGGRERRKKAAVDSDSEPEPERSASRKRSGGSGARVHDRVFNGDDYDQRRASFHAVIPACSPAPFMF
ncbi:uncharacterized protein LOC115727556 [Rhodamnia argentea]|uniref:Uncharacterized protein LOC115727556 n=1 Tax=Rhodamnia argentea TaxID=178133 RepID=A0A8B8MU86_9MYRT|nr:uncharacterized protein LOC115727556 [Rhodamnia argentea]